MSIHGSFLCPLLRTDALPITGKLFGFATCVGIVAGLRSLLKKQLVEVEFVERTHMDGSGTRHSDVVAEIG
jgi:hypothetical protein